VKIAHEILVSMHASMINSSGKMEFISVFFLCSAIIKIFSAIISARRGLIFRGIFIYNKIDTKHPYRKVKRFGERVKCLDRTHENS
jgi:hypothetical protein